MTTPSPCPLCEQGELTPFSQIFTDYLSRESFMLQYCRHCHCYMTHGVSTDSTTNYYGMAYYNSKAGKFSPIIEKLFRWNHQRNARWLYQSFQPHTVLEIGCGRAYLLRELQHFGCQVYCLEAATAAEWIVNNPEITVVTEHQGQWPFAPESFQFILFWHVFEHLPDPVTALKEATRVLAKNHVLCISVPNVASYQARLKLSTWFHLDVPRHRFHFSQQGLIKLLEKHGYEIVLVKSGDTLQNIFGWFQSVANLFTPQVTNTVYRFLQGGTPWHTAAKLPWLVQMVTAIIWVPVGLVGYVLEELSGHFGTVTVYARKK